MSSRTYVCFDCRTTERVPLARLTRDCRICRKPAEHVYFKLRVPRADDDDGWRTLMVAAREINTEMKARALALLRRKVADYVRVLETAPPHRRSTAQRHLREANERIAQWERWR